MNRKQFILVLLALALVGGAGLVLVQRSRQSWSLHEANAGGKVLPNFLFNEVATIHIKGATEFDLVRTNNSWCVPERANYRANYNQIKHLLLDVRDLKIVQSETVGPSQLGRVNLEPPGNGSAGGLLVQFKDQRGQDLGSLLLGKKHDRHQNESEPLGLHGFFDGRYLLLPSQPHNVLLVSDELAGAAPDPGNWLAPDFFKIQNIKLVSLLSPNPTNSWELSRPTGSGPWVMTGLKPDETLNASAAADVAEILAFPHFVDVAPKTAASVLASVKPTVVTIVTDYLACTLKVWPKGPEGNYPLTVAVTGAIPEERVPDVAENPQQRQQLDQDYPATRQQLLNKLQQEQALAPWVYQVDSWIEMVIRTRAQLLQPGSSTATQSAQR